MNKTETLKFFTNVPEIITFQFDDFKTGEGQYGQWFMYSIENRGVDKIFFPSETLHNILQTIGNLRGRTLEICRYEDGKYKKWKVLENGADITPTNITTKNSQKPRYGANLTSQDGSQRQSQREWALKVVSDIKELQALALELRMEIDGLKGIMLTEENEKAFELHKATTEPIREQFKKTDKGFINEENIEIRTDI